MPTFRIDTIDLDIRPSSIFEEIGFITSLWASLHTHIFHMFVGFTGLSEEMAQAIFYSLTADASQRGVALAAAESALARNESDEARELSSQIKSCFSAIKACASSRNDFAHAKISLDRVGSILISHGRPISSNSPKIGIFERFDEEFEKLNAINSQLIELVHRSSDLLGWPKEFPE